MRGMLATVAALAMLAGRGPSSAAPSVQVQPPRDSRERRATSTGALAGRVTASDTGQPIRWATLTLVQSARQFVARTTTDAEGRYRFDNLISGAYTLRASKAGLVAMSYGAARHRDPGKPISVEARMAATADFVLARGGAVEGRTLNEAGDPVQDVTVQVLRIGYDATGRRTLGFTRYQRSDDLGRFRIHSLPAGSYVIEASGDYQSPLQVGDFQEAAQRPRPFARTYYPGTPRLSEAQRVVVDAGRTTTIAFPLSNVPVATLTGSIIDSRGRAPQGATASLRSAGGLHIGGVVLPAKSDAFGFSSVPPGDYRLIVIARTDGSEPEFAQKPITMSGQNVAEPQIQTAPGVTLQGALEIESAPLATRPSGLGVAAHNTLFPGLTADPNDPRVPARVSTDGRFTFTNLFGPRLFRVDGAPQSWALKAVLLDGTDVTDVPVNFPGSRGARMLRVVLTAGTGSVSGLVAIEAGRSVAGIQAVVFAEDEQRWGVESRFTKVTDIRIDRSFEIRGLLPGRYLVACAIDLEPGAWTDPDVLRELRTAAVPIVVTERAETAVSLTMGRSQ